MIKLHTREIITLFIVVAWVFTGWPQVWDNPSFPPQSKQALADTTSVAYAGTSADGANGNDCIWQSPSNATGDTTGSSASCGSGGNNKFSNHLILTNFGFTSDDIPAGSTINGLTLEVEWQGGASMNDTTVQLTKDGTTTGVGDNKATGAAQTTKGFQTYGGSADDWNASLTQTDLVSSDFGVLLQYQKSSGGQPESTEVFRVRITVDYTPSANSAPAAPSQDSPVDATTEASTTPTFLMTATDSDGDNLGYKVTIYSNSACDTTVSTHDQSVTQTGWSGTDTTCTNNPTSCYSSGTQGSFTLQSGDALTPGTQYWWEASAKDPDGTGTFTDSTTCNTFTTASASVSITVDDGNIEYGSLTTGAQKTTISLADTQTASNTGDVNEDFDIKGQNTACPWTLAGASGTDQYVHEFSTDGGNGWTALTTSYQPLVVDVAPNNSQDFDLRLTAPSNSSCDSVQNVDVVIRVSAS